MTNVQGLTADAVKTAMWNLYKLGFGPRFQVMIHDELIFLLHKSEVKQCVPIIMKTMIDSYHEMCPDVKVEAEATLMTHWDKKGLNFNDATYDERGWLILDDTESIKKIKEQMKGK